MKTNIGVNGDSGLTTSLVTTAANLGGATLGQALLDEKNTSLGDAGYQGIENR